MGSVTYNFTGKTALVTGAGRGIGRATAIALSSAGAVVFALDKVQRSLDSVQQQYPNIRTVCVDLSDWDATKKAVESVGPVDLLVNNAVFLNRQPFLDIDLDTLDASLAVNIKAVVAVSQVVVKSMITDGRPGAIVNLSSTLSTRAAHTHAVYGATKAAVDQLTRSMAMEFGPHQIRVNAVRPTLVMNELGRPVWSNPSLAEPFKVRHVLGRFAEEQDIVDAILFLLSDKAAMIHGTLLDVDGGMLIG